MGHCKVAFSKLLPYFSFDKIYGKLVGFDRSKTISIYKNWLAYSAENLICTHRMSLKFTHFHPSLTSLCNAKSNQFGAIKVLVAIAPVYFKI